MTFAEKIFDALKISPDARPDKLDNWFPIALATLVSALFVQNLITRTWPVDPYWIEVAQTHFPVKTFYHREIAAGRMPLWIPHVALGYPTLTHSHGFFYYPVSIVYYIMNYLPAQTIFTIVNLNLLAIGIYMLFRALGLRSAGAFFGALIVAASGYSTTMTGFIPVSATQATSAFVVWSLLLLAKRRSVLNILLLSFATAIQYFSGDLEGFFYQWVFLIFGLWLYGFIFGKRIIGRRLITDVFVVGCITFLLTSVHFLLLLELFANSDRQTGFEILPLWDAIKKTPNIFGYFAGTFALPVPFQGHLSNMSFLGLTLFVFGLSESDRKQRIFLSILLAFCIFCGIQHLSPLQRIFNYLPILKGFRFPSRLIFFGVVIVGFSAGLGVQSLIESGAKVSRKKIALAFIYLVAYTIAMFLYAGHPNIAVVFGVAGATLLALVFFGAKLRFIAAAAFALLMIDPFYLSMSGIPKVATVEFQPYPEVQRLFDNNNAEKSYFRSIIVSRIRNSRFMSGEEGAWGGYTPAGPYSLYIKRFKAYFSLLAPPAFVFDENGETIKKTYSFDFFMNFYGKDLLTDSSLPWLYLSGIKYLMVDGNGYKFCGDDSNAPYRIKSRNTITVCESDAAFPRAFVVFEPLVFNDYERAFSYMRKNPDTDFRKTVILDSAPRGMESFEPRVEAELPKIETYSNDYIEIKTNSTGGGYLVLTDVYYPGWFAEVDGKPRKIIPANVAFRAVKLDAGDKRVVFKFRPPSYRIGLWTAISAWFFFVALTILRLKARA